MKEAQKIVKRLHTRGELDGMLAIGMSAGTAASLEIMSGLPLEVPKLVLSTTPFSSAINPDSIGNGVMLMSWVSEAHPTKPLTGTILKQAAIVVSAAAEAYDKNLLQKTE
jgi:uncharacterized protein (UPF0261 family)